MALLVGYSTNSLTDDETQDLVKNLWPREFRHLEQDPSDYANCLFWQAVPCTDGELSEWLQIVPNPLTGDRSRPFSVTHVPDVEDGEEDDTQLYELAVKFGGFLEHFNIGTLGNWDGTEHGAVKAVQTIVLSGGGYQKEWAATQRALNRLMNVVAKMAKPEQEVTSAVASNGTDNIFMQRRVFVKASTESAYNVPADVAHRAPELRVVGKTWHLDDRMEFGQVSRGGALKRATSFVFRPGHFVEVTAYVEIVKNKAGRIRVQLRPDRVVLVSTEGQMKGRMQSSKVVKLVRRRRPTLDAEIEARPSPAARAADTQDGADEEDENLMVE
ncbi:hypothetical protein AURDEDRAFT_131479 [Auricularia subglabra TFB-10046 SS5]|uniref:Uncharacterized protein n=1 Tax=Auricularia subglabra (strain TFB-10046 / SS5) TaxID=717982 RepID=J0D509_AURST|nr:hypothetical protein AURDEDRAFT_131479 [Auricularia subglabra TFB-10046 SS5]